MDAQDVIEHVASGDADSTLRAASTDPQRRQLALDLPGSYVGSVCRFRKGLHIVSTAKQRGAYYTDQSVAAFLVRWAMRHGSDVQSVLDPACGDGVFLRAACQVPAHNGKARSLRVLGVDIDSSAAAAAQMRLSREFGAVPSQLVARDFFDLPVGAYTVDAVVGNPPFVRFHRFAGAQRARALARAAEQGIRLSGLSSSWAPFVIHSVGMLRQGGQLAMVLPFEVSYAVYARPVLNHLLSSFAEVSVITFRHPLFPDLNEGTVLLLARDRGQGPGVLMGLDLEGASELESLHWDVRGSLSGAHRLDAGHQGGAERRLATHFLPDDAVELWTRLSGDPRLARLGHLADLGIGYVTGANQFFHLGPEEARAWAIPPRFLAAAVVRSRALAGLCFTESDWEGGLAFGCSSYLLHVNGANELPAEVLAYVRHGEAMGVSQGYKCRNRQPWFAVPQVAPPDAFLTYMSHGMPRLVANTFGAVAPNTLHCVRLKQGAALDGTRLALLWCNSLSLLSGEIEGHALGGGMLKLEPGEARRVMLPPVPDSWHSPDFERTFLELDAVLRAGRLDELLERVDRMVLGEALGLAASEWSTLRQAARSLRGRRLRRAA